MYFHQFSILSNDVVPRFQVFSASELFTHNTIPTPQLKVRYISSFEISPAACNQLKTGGHFQSFLQLEQNNG